MNISVIIPTYNRPEMTLRAIKSVLSQSFPPLEIIVVDDGSEVTTNYSSISPLVKYLQIPHCGLPGMVRNIGVDRAKGEYIAFLDSDDIWLKDKLFLQKKRIEETESPLVHTLERWERNGKFISQKNRKHSRVGYLFKESLQGCILGPSTVVMRRDIFNELGGFREDIEICEDYDLWLRYTDKYPVEYIDKELIIKVAGHDNLSLKYGMIEPFKIRVLKDLISGNNLSATNRGAAIESLKNKYEIYINGCIKRGKKGEADSLSRERESFFKAIT